MITYTIFNKGIKLHWFHKQFNKTEWLCVSQGQLSMLKLCTGCRHDMNDHESHLLLRRGGGPAVAADLGHRSSSARHCWVHTDGAGEVRHRATSQHSSEQALHAAGQPRDWWEPEHHQNHADPGLLSFLLKEVETQK